MGKVYNKYIFHFISNKILQPIIDKIVVKFFL